MKVNQKVQLTLTGYNELVKELEELKGKLPAAIDRVAKAREFDFKKPSWRIRWKCSMT